MQNWGELGRTRGGNASRTRCCQATAPLFTATFPFLLSCAQPCQGVPPVCSLQGSCPSTSAFSPSTYGLRLFATKTHAVVLHKQVAKLELDCQGKYWVRPPLSNVCPTVINIDFVQLKYSYTI